MTTVKVYSVTEMPEIRGYLAGLGTLTYCSVTVIKDEVIIVHS